MWNVRVSGRRPVCNAHPKRNSYLHVCLFFEKAKALSRHTDYSCGVQELGSDEETVCFPPLGLSDHFFTLPDTDDAALSGVRPPPCTRLIADKLTSRSHDKVRPQNTALRSARCCVEGWGSISKGGGGAAPDPYARKDF